jgi:hypothetical protein
LQICTKTNYSLSRFGGSEAVPNWFPLFLWCATGAVAGFILNANAKEYVGVSDILKKYNIAMSYGKLMVCDTLFFCVLGPLLMTGLYDPQAVAQAITLGLGWPFVIRGIISTTQVRAPSIDAQQDKSPPQVKPAGDGE